MSVPMVTYDISCFAQPTVQKDISLSMIKIVANQLSVGQVIVAVCIIVSIKPKLKLTQSNSYRKSAISDTNVSLIA